MRKGQAGKLHGIVSRSHELTSSRPPSANLHRMMRSCDITPHEDGETSTTGTQ